MLILRTVFIFLFSCCFLLLSACGTSNTNLQPKYGDQPKSDAQKSADAAFIASIDSYYKGDRKKGSKDVAARGWQLLDQGNSQDAMRRFNQSWLLDSTNGNALWGMAVIQAVSGKVDESLNLFAEAEQFVGGDIDFAADYAKALGIAGAKAKNQKLLKDAFMRFQLVYEKAPEHTLNLQNWAITQFYVGNYSEAWRLVNLAEATPRHSELDRNFVETLQSKMPRP